MRPILNKIFSRRLGLGKFFLSAIAFLLGLSLVLLSLQAYLKVKDFLSPDKNSSDYIVLNKEVGIGHTLFGGKAEFLPNDIQDLKEQSFVEDIGIFSTNQFKAKAYAGGDLGFRTDLFFESVPSQFIDDKPYNFKWNEGSDFLPLIVSQEFLNLYNFGYALGRGTPQLSKSTIGLVPFEVDIYGPGGRKTMNGKVVGFSERITSVLVPENFLTWANKEIGQAAGNSVSRVIIKVKSDQAQAMEKYFEDNNFKVSDDKLKFTRILSIISIVMSVLLFIGTAFIVFALVIVVMNFSLIISEAKEDISLLIQLGYKAKYLLKHLSLYLSIFMVLIGAASTIIFYFANKQLVFFLSENGMNLNTGVEPMVLLLGCAFLFLSFVIALGSISNVLRRI